MTPAAQRFIIGYVTLASHSLNVIQFMEEAGCEVNSSKRKRKKDDTMRYNEATIPIIRDQTTYVREYRA
jgi:hypothetical protein